MTRVGPRWSRKTWIILLVAAVVIVTVVVKVATRPAPYLLEPFPGTVDHPAAMTDYSTSLSEVGGKFGLNWRRSQITRVMEAPLADGTSVGRCFVTFGWVSNGFIFGPEWERPLTVEFAANGVIVGTADADRPCDAQAIARAAIHGDGTERMTLEQAVDWRSGGEHERYFVDVTYVPGEVDPDSVVMATRTPEAGKGIPPDSAIYAFHLSDLRLHYDNTEADAWDQLFGFAPAVSDA